MEGIGISYIDGRLVFGGWAWEGVAAAGQDISRDKAKAGIGRQRLALGGSGRHWEAPPTFACLPALCLPCRPLPALAVPCRLAWPAASFFGLAAKRTE